MDEDDEVSIYMQSGCLMKPGLCATSIVTVQPKNLCALPLRRPKISDQGHNDRRLFQGTPRGRVGRNACLSVSASCRQRGMVCIVRNARHLNFARLLALTLLENRIETVISCRRQKGTDGEYDR